MTALLSALLIALGPASNQPMVKIKDTSFMVEVVRTPAQWQKGLMFREHLGPREGMLFWGTVQRQQSFWMKNTYVSLDIIYIDKNWKIVSIAKNATPLSEKSLPSAAPATHVLEILGGESDRLGIRAGDRVTFLEPSLRK